MKNMNHFEDSNYKMACPLNQLKDREGKRFIIDDIEVAIFKVDGEIFALSNVCPHQHTALIYDGFIEDDNIVCPAHGWMFNLRTGKTPSGTRGLDSYDVKIVDDHIYVKVFKKRLNW
jgi:3-phenylpropionate/trans-cinnamate dioxygenase ferredoxin component